MAIDPLSHSSAQSLLSCEQKYYYYKIERSEVDSDYEKSTALCIGSAFHWIMEQTKHEKPESITSMFQTCSELPDIRLDEEHFCLVHAMVIKYLRLHKQMDLKLLSVELKLETKDFIGFVDAIMEDSEGKWWIVDLKTYKALTPKALPLLYKDPQMSLYAGHREAIAAKLDLDVEKFGGTRWRVVTKSTIKRRPREEDIDFTKRLVGSVKAYDIPIPFNVEAVDERLFLHKEANKRVKQLAKGSKPIRNYGNCLAYFTPCEYFSKCHGKNYSDIAPIDITEA